MTDFPWRFSPRVFSYTHRQKNLCYAIIFPTKKHFKIQGGIAMTRAKQYAVLFFSVFMLLSLSLQKDAYANGMSADSAQTLYNSVKSDYQSVTYEDFFALLNPYVSNTDKLNIRTAMTKELGRVPTDSELQARLQQIYMDKLGMRDAFDTVLQDLDTVFPKLLEHSSGWNATHLTNNKYQIMLGLTYLEKYYGFSVGETSAKDILLYDSNQDTITILSGLGSVSYADAKANNTAVVYTNKLSWVTGADEITDFLETLASSENCTGNEFFRKTTPAVIKETSQGSNFFEKSKNDSRLKSFLLPLLNLSSDSIYVISTTHTVTAGLTSAYGGTKDETFENTLNKTALSQQAFLDFWQRTSKTSDALKKSPEILLIDTLATGKDGSISQLWSAEYGSAADPGVAEFMTPMGYYRTYMFVGAEADTNGSLIQFFVSKCLTDTGVNTFSHELTHIYDETVWLNGNSRRTNVGNETFATGLFETENNTQTRDGGESSYAPIFSLNTAYELGANRIQNQSPSRFRTPEDIQQYMNGLMDIVYTLEIIEAEEILKLSDEDKAILLNRVTLVDDTTAPENAPRKLDCFENISVEDAAELHTIDDLVDNGIVSGRLIPKGSSTTQTINYNDYVVIPMFEGVYAGLQNDSGAVGDFLFKRYAYELLAEYGWEDGFIAYISNLYAGDKEALENILAEGYSGNLAAFKKDMLKRRAENMSTLKPTAGYANTDALRSAIHRALTQDLADMKSGRESGSSYYMSNVKAVQNVKADIFKEYLLLTNDFRTSVYGNGEPDDVPGDGPVDDPTDDPIDDPGDTDIKNPTPNPAPAKNTILVDKKSGASYKVTSAQSSNRSVSYQKPKNKKVKTVSIPDTVTIGGYKYKVTGIAKNAFKGCTRLRKVTIGKHVTTIGIKAFYGCKKLKNITVKTKKLTLQKVGRQAFKGISSDAVFKIPANRYKKYKNILKKRGAGKTTTFKKL